jgi:hypothetical protein
MLFIAQQRVAYASSSLHTENQRVAVHVVLAITAAFDEEPSDARIDKSH